MRIARQKDENCAWLQGLNFSLVDSTLFVYFPHAHFRDWFATNKKRYFETLLAEALPRQTFNLVYEIPAIRKIPDKTKKANSEYIKFNFDNFLDNGKNSRALEAAKACAGLGAATPPAPLLFYGPSGCGKTHLLKAIINILKEKIPLREIDVCQNQGLCYLKMPYRPDALIIDNLQELKNSAYYQALLAARIDKLLETSSTPIVLAWTGTIPAPGILDQRLLSRIHAGILVELRHPDLEVRIQYAEKISRQKKLGLSRGQILFLARQSKDFPILKGLLGKIEFFISLYGQLPDDTEMLRLAGNETSGPDWRRILAQVSKHLAVSTDDILGVSRKPELVFARQLAMFLCRSALGISYPELGRLFGGKDHSTVMHGIKKIQHLRDTDKDMRNLLTELENEIIQMGQVNPQARGTSL